MPRKEEYRRLKTQAKEELEMLSAIEAWVAATERCNRQGDRAGSMLCRRMAKRLADTVQNFEYHDAREAAHGRRT